MDLFTEQEKNIENYCNQVITFRRGFNSSVRTFAKAIHDRACFESSRVRKYRIINSTFLVPCGFFVNHFIQLRPIGFSLIDPHRRKLTGDIIQVF